MRAFYSPGRQPVWEKKKKAYYSFSLQLIQFLVETWAQWRVSSHPVSVTRDMRCEIFSQNVQIFLSRDGNLRKTSWNGATDHKSRAESTELAARRRGRPASDPRHWPHSKYWVIPPRNKTLLIVPSGKKAPGVWIQPDFDSLYIDNPRDSILDELPK